jgi:hypothetical protein
MTIAAQMRPFSTFRGYCVESQGCQIFLDQQTKMAIKYTKKAIKYTKMAIKVPNGYKLSQIVPSKGLQNCTKIGIFGMVINHLATLN